MLDYIAASSYCRNFLLFNNATVYSYRIATAFLACFVAFLSFCYAQLLLLAADAAILLAGAVI